MKRFYIIALLLIGCFFKSYAQFSYSAKAGWSWPNIHKGDAFSTKSGITLGATADYAINAYWGLQSGINYKRISFVSFYFGGGNHDDAFTKETHFVEVPLLLTFSTIPAPERWRAIWNAGMYVDVPIGGDKDKQTFYGLMAALQLEMFSHYFIRGEYQWALSSDMKGYQDRRTNMLSVSIGYRF